ncbi:MAG: hypothetical protein QXP70_01715 [Methanomassiliicoccales archaeon]
MRRIWYPLALLSIFFASLAVRLIPPIVNSVWGPDTGENYYLANYFALHLSLPAHYLGFGMTYTEFPAVYIITGLAARLTGLSTFMVAELIMPFLTSFLIFPIAGIVLSLTGRHDIALASAAFYAGAAPVVGHTSILASDTLGEFLLVYFYYFCSRRGRLTLPAVLTAIAMVPAYHVGTIMLLLFAYCLLALHASFSSKKQAIAWLIFIFAISTEAWVYWLTYAKVFLEIFILGNPHLKLAEAILVPYLLALLVYFLSPKVIPASLRALKGLSHFRGVLPISGLVVVPFLIFSFTGLPSESLLPSPLLMLFVPTAFIAVAGGLFISQFTQEHEMLLPFVIAFLLTLLIIIVGVLTNIAYLVPARVIEFAILLLCPFAGYAVFRMEKVRRGVGIAAVCILLVSTGVSMATIGQVISPSKMGLMPYQDVEASVWLKWYTQDNVTVASDHPLSSIAFGIGERNATWEIGGYPIFSARNSEALQLALQNTSTPAGVRETNVLFIDAYMIDAGNYYPTQTTIPMSGALLKALSSHAFILIYSNGFTSAYVYVR